MGLSGCSGTSADLLDPEKHDFHDKKQNLSRDDYRNMTRDDVDTLKPHFDGEPTTKVELGEPPIPEVSQILAAPRPPALGESKQVSIFVTEDVPLKDVLIELARLADVDVEIDAGIQGGIVFRAQNRPFNEVVDRISRLAGLRYEMKEGTLHFARDTPDVKTYTMDFLSFDRSGTSDMNITTAVLSSSGGTGALNSGSSAAITYTAESDFWEQMEAALEAILGYRQTNGASSGEDSEGGGRGASADDGETFYVVNRQANTLTISGTSYHHKMVEDYLKRMQEVVSSQVLIEAKIIEVTLDENFASGVDWNRIFSSDYLTGLGNYNTVQNTGQNITQFLVSPNGNGTGDGSIDAVVSLTEQFGTTRTLSSPRIHAMNNQQAVLTFARNFVYFDIDATRETETDSTGASVPVTSYTSEVVTVPVGIILSIQPSINMKTQEISLAVRPTLSRIADFVEDPTIALIQASTGGGTGGDAELSNRIPIIEVRELDSLVRMRSGQIMVLGGLMEQIGDTTENGMPFVSSVPWVGNAFKGVARNEQVKELFFLIKATIVGTNTNVDSADKKVYKKFISDHRPLAF